MDWPSQSPDLALLEHTWEDVHSGYKGEKRGRATDSVIPLRGLPYRSYDCYSISRFFLVNRDPYGKIEKITLWVQ